LLKKVFQQTTRFWEAFARFWRWLFVLFVLAAWLTRHGGEAWHEWLGYGALLTASLRIAMGIVRSKRARYKDLVQSTAQTYVDSKKHHTYALVAVLLATVITALSGWLHATDSYWGVTWIGAMHSLLAFALVIAMVAFGAVIVFGRFRENRI